MTNLPPATAAPAAELAADVVARFQAGDLDALGLVFDHYSGPVMAVVRKILRDPDQAEDAVQETFMKAWRAAHTFDRQRALGPWLFTIARRAAIDVVRREGRPTRSAHDELNEDIVVDAIDATIDRPEPEAAWEAWEIRVALDQLPADERLVVGVLPDGRAGGTSCPEEREVLDRIRTHLADETTWAGASVDARSRLLAAAAAEARRHAVEVGPEVGPPPAAPADLPVATVDLSQRRRTRQRARWFGSGALVAAAAAVVAVVAAGQLTGGSDDAGQEIAASHELVATELDPDAVVTLDVKPTVAGVEFELTLRGLDNTEDPTTTRPG